MQVDLIAQTAGNGMGFIEDAKAVWALKATDYKAPPVACYKAAGFVARQGASAGSIGYEPEKSPTLRAEMSVEVVYEKH